MQAVILAAGKSSRFFPYTNLPHKSCISILGKMLIEHTLESIHKSGINDVVIVVSKNSQIPDLLGDGKQYGLAITYARQESPEGQGDALLAAKELIHGDFFLLHAHRVDFFEYKTLLEEAKGNDDVILLAKKEADLSSFGVLQLEGDRVLDIIEKPQKGEEPSDYRIIGIYLLNKDFLTVLEKTPLEHYHFEKALTTYAKEKTVRMVKTEHESFSLKYPWHIFALKDYLLSKLTDSRDPSSEISETASISGVVHIGKNSKVLENAVIKGPCFIGDNVLVGDGAMLRDNTVLENDTRVGAFTEVKNSLLQQGATIHSGFLGDSIIGKNCKIGALFATANVRLDRTSVRVEVNGKGIDSGLRDLGVIMGDNVKVGTRVSVMPGKVIGNNALVGPSTTVMKNIDPDTSYYTKVQEVVEKSTSQKATVDKPLVLFDIDYTLFNTDIFKQSNLTQYELFEEVIDVLIALGNSCDLGIFSQGELDFQKAKLLETNIYKYFLENHVHIVNSKEETMEEILTQYQGRAMYLIDDKLDVLYLAKSHMPNLKTIWIKRGIFFEKQEPIKGFQPDFEVDTLHELPHIVQRSTE